MKKLSILFLFVFFVGCTNHAALMQQHQDNEIKRLELIASIQPGKAFEFKAADPSQPIVLQNVGEFVVYGPSPIRGDDFRMSNYQAPPNEFLQAAGIIIPPMAMLGGQWISGHYEAKRWSSLLSNGLGYNFSNDGGGDFNFTGGIGDTTGDGWSTNDQLHPFAVTPYEYESSTGSNENYWETQP